MDALDRIEGQLAADDPRFVARMRTLQRPSPTPWLLGAALYIALPLVGLLFGPRAALAVLAVTATVIAALALRRR